MSSTRLQIALLLAAAAWVGCTDDNAPTDVSIGPDFNASNGPSDPGGSGVVRFTAPIGAINTWDEETGLIARHYSPEDFCEAAETPGWEFQLVTHPRGVKDAVNAHLKAEEIPVYLYLLSDVPPDFQFPPEENLSGLDYQEACEDLRTKWLYRGTHSIMITDNDGFCSRQDPSSLGYVAANAFVEDRDGNLYRYHESARLVAYWDPGCEDAEVLEREFRPEFTTTDLVNLPNYSVFLKLMSGGTPSLPFSADILPPIL